MKKIGFFIVLVLLVLAACGPSDNAVEIAQAQSVIEAARAAQDAARAAQIASQGLSDVGRGQTLILVLLTLVVVLLIGLAAYIVIQRQIWKHSQTQPKKLAAGSAGRTRAGSGSKVRIRTSSSFSSSRCYSLSCFSKARRKQKKITIPSFRWLVGIDGQSWMVDMKTTRCTFSSCSLHYCWPPVMMRLIAAQIRTSPAFRRAPPWSMSKPCRLPRPRLICAEWQATVQAAATQDAMQAAYVAAQATDESIRAAAAATQTQQVWSATATADSSQATATAAANATAVSWSGTATQAAWKARPQPKSPACRQCRLLRQPRPIWPAWRPNGSARSIKFRRLLPG